MAVTSIDINPLDLQQAKELAGTRSNRETVELALRTLIALRRQSEAVEQIIAHDYELAQSDPTTVTPTAEAVERARALVGVANTDSTA